MSAGVEETIARVDEMVARGWTELRNWLPKRMMPVAKDLEKSTRRLNRELAKSRREAFERLDKTLRYATARRRKAAANLERNGKRITTRVEKATRQVVRPLTETLDLASHAEVAKLQRRVAQLEHKAKVGNKAPRTAPRRHQAA